MNYALKKFAIIEPADLQRLAAAGIADTEQLLRQGAFPEQRTILAEKLRLPQERLLFYLRLADLARVNGVGPKLAQLLALVPDIRTVQDLAQSEVETLAPQLRLANEQHAILQRIPSEQQLARTIAAARQLPEQLSLPAGKTPDFTFELAQYDQQEEAATTRLRGSFIGLAAALFAVFLAASVIRDLVLYYDRWQPQDAALRSLMNQVELTWFLFGLAMPVSMIVFLSLMISAAYLLWHIPIVRAVRRLRRRLFSQPASQRYYLYIQQQMHIERQLRSGRGMLITLLSLGILMLIGLLILALSGHDISYALKPVLLSLAAAGAILIVIGILPYGRSIWAIFRSGQQAERSAYHRYISLLLAQALAMLLWFLFVLHFLMPVTIKAHRALFARVIMPPVSASMSDQIDAISDYPVRPADAAVQQQFLAKFNGGWLLSQYYYVLFLDPAGDPMEEAIQAAVGDTVLWLIVPGIVIAFVVPFLLLGSPLHAILFVVFIILSELVETAVQRYLPQLFFLPNGSLTAFITIGLVYLFNGLLFDRLYGVATDRHAPCPACGTMVDIEAAYCGRCGSPQPQAFTPTRYEGVARR